MHLVRIDTAAVAIFEEAMALYAGSFPLYEQRRVVEQKQVMGEAAYHFNLLYEAEVFIGLALYWEHADFVYVEHFCTLPQVRNKGYGLKILQELAKLNKTVILEIDPPQDEMSIRRQHFYERAGYFVNDFMHRHPPYRLGHKGHSLVVMSYPTKLSPESYMTFNNYLQNTVMLYAEK